MGRAMDIGRTFMCPIKHFSTNKGHSPKGWRRILEEEGEEEEEEVGPNMRRWELYIPNQNNYFPLKIATWHDHIC